MPYYTYILYSKSLDSYYVGQTQDLVKRLHHYHNAGKCDYTKRGIPWSLVYSKEFPTRSEAMEYERAIKNRKSRKYIQSLVQSVPSLKIKSHQRSSAQSARNKYPLTFYT